MKGVSWDNAKSKSELNGIVKIIVLCINTFEIKKENIIKFDSFACWKVSWSPMGN